MILSVRNGTFLPSLSTPATFHPFRVGTTSGGPEVAPSSGTPGAIEGILPGTSGLPLSDPPFPRLTGSLGLTSPLQLWQKNRCCCTAAAASAIFPHGLLCRHSSGSSERSTERPRTSGQLVCFARGQAKRGGAG